MTSHEVGRRGRPSQRGAVVRVLAEQDAFRSAHDLHARLQQLGARVGLTTLYRHLSLLVSDGLADSARGGDGELWFRLCDHAHGLAPETGCHHHHVVCRVCGKAAPLAVEQLEEVVEKTAAAEGFTQVSHRIDYSGLCSSHASP